MLFTEETQEKVPSRPFYTAVDAAHKVEIQVYPLYCTWAIVCVACGVLLWVCDCAGVFFLTAIPHFQLQ